MTKRGRRNTRIAWSLVVRACLVGWEDFMDMEVLGQSGCKGNLSVFELAGNRQDSYNLKWEANPRVDGKRGLDGLDMQNGEWQK